MKKVICKVPVIYNGEWHSTGEEFEIEEVHEEELSALCIPVREAKPETPAETQEPAKSRRHK